MGTSLRVGRRARVVLHLAMHFWPATRYGREQTKYADESAIRLRFVPALVEALTDTITGCIY